MRQAKCTGKVPVDAAGMLCACRAFHVSARSVDTPALRFCSLSPVNEDTCRNCHHNPIGNGISMQRSDAISSRFPSGSITIDKSGCRRQGVNWPSRGSDRRFGGQEAKPALHCEARGMHNAILKAVGRIDCNMGKARRLSVPADRVPPSRPRSEATCRSPDRQRGRHRREAQSSGFLAGPEPAESPGRVPDSGAGPPAAREAPRDRYRGKAPAPKRRGSPHQKGMVLSSPSAVSRTGTASARS